MKALTKSVRELTSSVDQRVDWLALWEVVGSPGQSFDGSVNWSKKGFGEGTSI